MPGHDTAIDLGEHRGDVARWKFVTDGRPNRGDFLGRITAGLSPLRLIECPTHPRGNREPLAGGKPSDLGKLVIWQEHLKPLTHDVSIF